MRTPAWLGSGMPLLFVLLWSTGFLGAKFGLPYAEPFTFLAIRLLLAAALLAAFALLSGAPWPGSARLAGHVAVAGLLVHGLYLGGVFLSIEHGMSAGLTSCWSACNRWLPRPWPASGSASRSAAGNGWDWRSAWLA